MHVRNLKYNNSIVEQPVYNNINLKKWIHNGVVIWENGLGKDNIIYPTRFQNYFDILSIVDSSISPQTKIVQHSKNFIQLDASFCYCAMTYSDYPDILFITNQDNYYNSDPKLYIINTQTEELLYTLEANLGFSSSSQYFKILEQNKILESNTINTWLVHTFNSSFTEITNTQDLSRFINDVPEQTPLYYRNIMIRNQSFLSRYIVRYRRAYDLLDIYSSLTISNMFDAIGANAVKFNNKYIYLAGKRSNYGNIDFLDNIYIRDVNDNTLCTIDKTDYGSNVNYITLYQATPSTNIYTYKINGEQRFALPVNVNISDSSQAGFHTQYRLLEFDSNFNKLQDIEVSYPGGNRFTITYIDHDLSSSSTRNILLWQYLRSNGRLNSNTKSVDNLVTNGSTYSSGGTVDVLVCSDINGIDPFGRNSTKCIIHHYNSNQI